MRIRKKQDVVGAVGVMATEYTESENAYYNAPYVNGKTKKVYSTDEVKTDDVWVDGRPIYRKTFTGTTENDGTTQITTDFNANNITLINAYGQVYYMQIGGYVNANWYNGTYLNVGGLHIYHSGELNNHQYNLTIEYVKTSDQTNNS